MKRLLEYEGKELLQKYQIPVPAGRVATSVEEAVQIAGEIDGEVALKAQVLAGGRGLAGGIRFAGDEEAVRREAEQLFNTRIRGLKVDKLLVEEKLAIRDEFYVSIMLDRTEKKPKLLGTVEGGVNIEELGREKPELIAQLPVNPLIGVEDYHGLYLFSQFELPGELRKAIARLLTRLYRIFRDQEAFLVEINPLVITEEQEVIAADCKVIIDPEASYLEKESSPRYIPLDGDIGIFANGAGLTMTTMDVVKEYGGNPANFLEVGGEFYKRADEALEYLLDRKGDVLRGLMVNLFGAYARTDVIIRQVVDVLKKRELKIPVSFRIRGTGEEIAREIVETELNRHVHLDLGQAVEELIKAIGVDSNES